MFDKVPASPDLISGEHAILEFWHNSDAFEKLRRQTAGGPRWSFLDGPITANNPMGVHHAWGRTYKDCYQRYFAMSGHELRWQNGFDCQGLWVEVEVERELGFRSKRDIEEYGIAEFVQKCKQRVDHFARRQTEQSIRLGFWMDWDRDEDWQRPPGERRSYFTMSEENNYTIWAFLKKCHQRGLIYKGFDSMPWCPRCGVGISQMEMHEGYVRVAHRAVFVKFPLRGRLGENLLVWTTTPWTLTSNVAAAVHPELTYVKVKHHDEIYYLAKEALTFERLAEEFRRKEWVEGVEKLKTLAQHFKERGGYEIVGKLQGKDLVGLEYEGPFDHLAAQAHAGGYPSELAEVVLTKKWSPPVAGSAVHRVISWDLVGASEGTGIVHIAPGCGREDFELGKQHGLPPIAPLDESGCFLAGFGELEGRPAGGHKTTDAILEHLRTSGRLFGVEQYPHAYPHCWRCKTELLFRLVDEWFIDMSWRDEIKAVCQDIKWIPSFGLDRELDWLTNMGDWMISKKRYWGLALPIWECTACGHFDVIGGRDELHQRAVAGWKQFDGHSPHRPFVDQVEIRCDQCGETARRIPDVGNPWLDAGIVPFSTMKYNTDRAYWEKWFPADFVTESFPGQFRNWFYSLLAMSTMMEGRAPFKTLLGYALMRDEHGEEMHKSKGNAIWFDDAAEQIGVDVMRWIFCRHNPVNNLNFGYTECHHIERKVFGTLWNTYAFFVNYALADRFDPRGEPVPVAERPEIDRWILSRLHALIINANEYLSAYNVANLVRDAEDFIHELSNWYVRRNRRRFWRSRGENDRDKWAAYQTLHEVLVTLCKLLGPVIPFLTERMYQNLVRSWDTDTPESLHLCSYPQPLKAEADALEVVATYETVSILGKAISGEATVTGKLRVIDFPAQVARRVVNLGHSLRERATIRVRQPLSELRVVAPDEKHQDALNMVTEVIRNELNVKRVTVCHDLDDLVAYQLKANFGKLGPKYGKEVQAIAKALADASADVVAALRRGDAARLIVDGKTFDLEPGDVTIQTQQHPDWLAAEERELRVALCTKLTPKLEREGLARDVVRHIQQGRKEADFDIQDRIELRWDTDNKVLAQAIEEWAEYINAETLCVQLIRGLPPETEDGWYRKQVRIGEAVLHLALRRSSV